MSRSVPLTCRCCGEELGTVKPRGVLEVRDGIRAMFKPSENVVILFCPCGHKVHYRGEIDNLRKTA